MRKNTEVFEMESSYDTGRTQLERQYQPMLTEPGKVHLDSFGVEYEKGDGFLRVKNLGNAGRSFLLCLDGEEKRVEINGQEEYLWQKQTDK